MSESTQEQPLIALALSKAGATVFRNNTAMAWVGESIRQKDGSILLRNPRPLHAGLTKGSSDLIGWRPLKITPDMVGQTFAQFLAVEVKTASGRATKEQLNFIDQVRKAGGIAGIARSPSEAVLLLEKKLL